MWPLSNANRNLINFILFQTAWFLCVIKGSSWALVVTLICLTIHFSIIVKKSELKVEVYLMASIFLIGVLVDSLLMQLDLLWFPNDQDLLVVPLWLACLWLNFSMTLRHSVAWIFNKPRLLLPVSLIVAPWSYYAASLFGVIRFENFILVIIAVYWALLMYSCSKCWLIMTPSEHGGDSNKANRSKLVSNNKAPV